MSLKTTIELIDKVSSGFESAASSGAGAMSEIERSVSAASESYSRYNSNLGAAASSMDHWTSAVGGYSKSALEATYTTEELVEQGLKSQQALDEQNEMFAVCEWSARNLSKSLEATTEIENQLSDAIADSTVKSEELVNSDSVSAQTKEELTEAISQAAEEMLNLKAAQEEAEAAQE